MNLLIPPEPGNHEWVKCSECGTSVSVYVLQLIDQQDQIGLLLDGKINRGDCAACGKAVFLELPITVRFPNTPMWPIEFIPYGSLEEPGVLECLSRIPDYVRLVFSMDELTRLVCATLLIASHREERKLFHRSIVIPEEVLKRITGTYKKAKLKTIWFLSTCFEEGKTYTDREVDKIIGHSLTRMENNGGCSDVTQLRSALCELKFLNRTPDGRTYWKPSSFQNSEA